MHPVFVHLNRFPLKYMLVLSCHLVYLDLPKLLLSFQFSTRLLYTFLLFLCSLHAITIRRNCFCVSYYRQFLFITTWKALDTALMCDVMWLQFFRQECSVLIYAITKHTGTLVLIQCDHLLFSSDFACFWHCKTTFYKKFQNHFLPYRISSTIISKIFLRLC